MIRCMLVKSQGHRELNRLIHPKAIYTIKMGKQPMSDDIISAVWGFMSVFFALFIFLLLLLLALDLDFTTAFSALVSCMSNTGAGIGKVAGSYAFLGTRIKSVLIVAMLLGRLEVFTVIVLFMPAYWRR